MPMPQILSALPRHPRRIGSRPRRLVWFEVRDLLDIADCASVDELLFALEQYRDDPPLPNEPVDS